MFGTGRLSGLPFMSSSSTLAFAEPISRLLQSLRVAGFGVALIVLQAPLRHPLLT
jgi:hypothetical protein